MPATTFRVVANLLPVGPLVDPRTADAVILALQLAGSYDAEPADTASFDELAPAACPWNFIDDDGELMLAFNVAADGSVAELRPKPVPLPLADRGIAEPLALRFEQHYCRGEAADLAVDLAYVVPPSTPVPTPVESEREVYRLAELLFYLSTLPGQVSNSLRATLYVKVDLATLRQQDWDLGPLVLLPDLVRRKDGQVVERAEPVLPTQPLTAVATVFPYAPLAGLDVVVETLPCRLFSVQPPPMNGLDGFSFATYWLDRPHLPEESWLDALDRRLRTALDTASVVTSVSFTQPAGDADPATLDEAWGTAALASLLVDTVPHPVTPEEGPLLQDHVTGAAARLAKLLITTQTPAGQEGAGHTEFDDASPTLTAAFKQLYWELTLDDWHDALLRHAGMPTSGGPSAAGTGAASARRRSRLAVVKQVRGDARLYQDLPWLLWRMALARPAARTEDATADAAVTARRQLLLQALDSLPQAAARAAVAFGVPLPERRRTLRQRQLLSAIGQNAQPSAVARSETVQAVVVLIDRLGDDLRRRGMPPGEDGMILPVLGTLAHVYLDRIWPAPEPVAAMAATADPVTDLDRLPRGIRILLGEPQAEETLDAAPEEALRQLAGVGLAVRRGRAGQAGTHWGEWRIVTSGSLWTADDEAGGKVQATRLAGRVVVPYRLAHIGGVTRPEMVYRGSLLGIDDPLAAAVATYRLSEAGPSGIGDGHLTDGHQLIHYREPEPKARGLFDAMRAPALRYGDVYQLAVFGIGSAGGLPPEIADADTPFEPAPATGWSPPPSAVAEDTYRRTVAVGPISFNPETPADAEFWPKPPAGVSPRLHEILRDTPAAGVGAAGDRPPLAFLTPGTAEYDQKLKSSFRFHIMAPGIDPQTLREWCTPPLPTNAEEQRTAAAAVERLAQALIQHFDTLSTVETAPSAPLWRLAGDSIPLLAEPAVVAIGVRAWLWNESMGDFVEEVAGALFPLTYRPGSAADLLSFTANPVPAEVRCDPDAMAALSVRIEQGTTLSIVVAPGRIARIECHALLRADDMPRFTDKARRALGVLEDPGEVLRGWRAQGYAVLPGSTFAVETARVVTVDAHTLWKALTVEERGDFIELSVARTYKKGPLFGPDAAETLALFSRFEIEVERWVWRGQPVIVPPLMGRTIGGTFGEPPTDAYRLRGDGKPMPQEERDSSPDILLWEAVAAIGGRFLGRPTIAGPWPHGANRGSGPVVLALDPQENFRGRSYRRYALRLESRYSGALKNPAAGVSGMERALGLERWRRIVTSHRAGRPQPPKILAILPLTRGFEEFPAKARKNLAAAAPQLVIVDEIPYREHGIGDALLATVTEDRVNMVPGAPSSGDAPWMVGPAPDSYWSADNVGPLDPSTIFARQSGAPPELRIMGPFGHTFDTADVDPGINAASYVVLPPDGIGPRWFAAVAFSRAVRTCVADTQSGEFRYEPEVGKISEPTAPMQLFFTGDAFALAPGNTGGSGSLAPPRLTVAKRRIDYDPAAFFVLHPTASAEGLARIPAGKDPAAATHRYFLLLTQVVADQTGEPFDARVSIEGKPERALAIFRVDPATHGAETVDPIDGLDALTPLRGRLLEVELNGRYTIKAHAVENPLLQAQPPGMREFWRALFPGGDQDKKGQLLEAKQLTLPDAHGTVRRVSAFFPIVTKAP
ncbi:hypothetical protein [Azospirillum sp.]|uniref:hypothetical protein n=1 Tax=Azospirillum sp. TaxID=34012 RepID=UPI002D50786A|nr:hypothetical protein [Azospirillum sp.]HYF85015.1 hypothetical protein [Azospirillum sp.]